MNDDATRNYALGWDRELEYLQQWYLRDRRLTALAEAEDSISPAADSGAPAVTAAESET